MTANAGQMEHWARTSVRHSPLWQSDGLNLFSEVALKRLESDVTSVCIIMQVRRRTASDPSVSCLTRDKNCEPLRPSNLHRDTLF